MAFSIRTAGVDEVAMVLGWAAAEGWNPGRSDAGPFHAADPAGFHVGELDGRIVAAIAAVRYGGDFAFVGLYLVRPEFRGRGLGLATWRHALAPLAGMNVGLDGVVARQADYAASGFVTAHRNIRYGGTPAAGAAGAASALPAIPPPAWPAIHACDRRYFPAERRAFLEAWLAQPGVETCYAERDGNVRAYGVMRPCRIGWKIGPWFAAEEAEAQRVLATLLGRSAGQPVFVDVAETNPAAAGLVRRAGLSPVFETARMYTRGQPADVDWAGVFGITTFELG